jgi:integrase
LEKLRGLRHFARWQGTNLAALRQWLEAAREAGRPHARITPPSLRHSIVGSVRLKLTLLHWQGTVLVAWRTEENRE